MNLQEFGLICRETFCPHVPGNDIRPGWGEVGENNDIPLSRGWSSEIAERKKKECLWGKCSSEKERERKVVGEKWKWHVIRKKSSVCTAAAHVHVSISSTQTIDNRNS